MKVLSMKVLSITKWPNKKGLSFQVSWPHYWVGIVKKRILLLIMVHNVAMYISFFFLVKKLVLLTVYLKLNRLQKNSDSLVTWHMPGTKFDDFSYLS